MKLCAPMVEAMGGSDSPYYRHFRTYCCEAYNILRKSATLILSLFHLMAGAAIPDVRQDPEKAMLKLQVWTVRLYPDLQFFGVRLGRSCAQTFRESLCSGGAHHGMGMIMHAYV